MEEVIKAELPKVKKMEKEIDTSFYSKSSYVGGNSAHEAIKKLAGGVAEPAPVVVAPAEEVATTEVAEDATTPEPAENGEVAPEEGAPVEEQTQEADVLGMVFDPIGNALDKVPVLKDHKMFGSGLVLGTLVGIGMIAYPKIKEETLELKDKIQKV